MNDGRTPLQVYFSYSVLKGIKIFYFLHFSCIQNTLKGQLLGLFDNEGWIRLSATDCCKIWETLHCQIISFRQNQRYLASAHVMPEWSIITAKRSCRYCKDAFNYFQVPIFMETDENFMRQLSLKAISYIFSPGNIFAKLFIISEKIYWVVFSFQCNQFYSFKLKNLTRGPL